jgi:phosphoserine phosphatase
VLIADPKTRPLDSRLVREAGRLVKGEPRWLAPEAAAEIAIEGATASRDEALAALLDGAAVDWATVSLEDRRKRLLVADMDSTIITIECIDELADFAGIKEEVALVTRRAMNGEIDFKDALAARVALLAGVPAGAIEEICRTRIALTLGAEALVRTMRAHGATTALVSGGFTAFTAWVREAAGFDLDEANELEIVDDRLTGRVIGEIRDASSKLRALEELAREGGWTMRETLAVGDGANDLPMIRRAGLGVAYHAHARVREAAPVRVDHADLTALLYLQGYTAHEIVGG